MPTAEQAETTAQLVPLLTSEDECIAYEEAIRRATGVRRFVERRGGVTADDRVEVQPWIEKEERFSFVSSDPRAIDLDCFKHLAKRED